MYREHIRIIRQYEIIRLMRAAHVKCSFCLSVLGLCVHHVFEVPSSLCCVTKHMYPPSLCPPHLKNRLSAHPHSRLFVLHFIYNYIQLIVLPSMWLFDPSTVNQNISFKCGHQTSGPWAQEQVSTFINWYFITVTAFQWMSRCTYVWPERRGHVIFWTSVQVHTVQDTRQYQILVYFSKNGHGSSCGPRAEQTKLWNYCSKVWGQYLYKERNISIQQVWFSSDRKTLLKKFCFK